MTELVALLTSPMRVPRREQVRIVETLRFANWIHILHIDPEQDEAGWQRRLVKIGSRKAVFQRQNERVAEWREAGDQQQDRANADETASPARPAGPNQDGAITDQQRDQR